MPVEVVADALELRADAVLQAWKRHSYVVIELPDKVHQVANDAIQKAEAFVDSCGQGALSIQVVAISGIQTQPGLRKGALPSNYAMLGHTRMARIGDPTTLLVPLL